MSRNIGKKLLRAFLWTLLGIVVLVAAIPILLYIPFIQDFAVKTASEQIERSTGMKVEIEKLRLKFPLNLSVDGTTVIQENGDTMLTAANLSLGVRLRPLFSGRIDVDRISLRDAFYQLGNCDSTLWLRAKIDRAVIDDTDITLSDSRIDLSKGDIDGVNVRLRILEDTVTTPSDSSAAIPWKIKAGSLSIRDLDYSMEMKPTIDSLGLNLGSITLSDADIDLSAGNIFGKSLIVDSISATYLYPAVSDATPDSASQQSLPADTTQLWTIKADTISISATNAIYAQTGISPSVGFDPSYIEVSDVDILIVDFYNRGTAISLPLHSLKATERCGLRLYAGGTFTMDDREMKASGFEIETLRSSLKFDAVMGTGDLVADLGLPLSLKASANISPAEVAMAFPMLDALIGNLPPLSISADIDGTSSMLNVYHLDMRMRDMAHISMQGVVNYPFNDRLLGGEISIDGNLASLSDKEFAMLPLKKTPAMEIRGTVAYHPGAADGEIEIIARDGSINGSGRWTAKTESYNASLSLNDFPVDAFMPEFGIGRVTATAVVDGIGYNPFDRHTAIDADLVVDKLEYNQKAIGNIELYASLSDGEVNGHFESNNPFADAAVDFKAFVNGDSITWDIDSKLNKLDLYAMGMADTINEGHLDLKSGGYYNVKSSDIDATLSLSNLTWDLAGEDISSAYPIALSLRSDSILRSSLTNGDLELNLWSDTTLFAFIDKLNGGMAELTSQIDSMKLDVSRINRAFPKFQLMLDMKANNFPSRYLARTAKIGIGHLTAGLHNDSLINLNAFITDFRTGDTKIDTISFNAIQRGQFLAYDAQVNNRPGTFDDFAHVKLNGFAGSNRLSVFLKQENIKGEKGFNLGLSATLADSVVNVKFLPAKPTIAYKPWTLNSNNFISFDLVNKHIDADLELQGDNSFIKLFTEHVATPDSIHSHDMNEEQEELVLQISRIRLQDWLAINPFAPPIKGDLNADLRFNYDDGVLTGKGFVGLKDLFYGKDRVGDFDLALEVANSDNGKLMADVSLMVDSVKTITARGILNDSTAASPFLLDFRMVRFPLRVVNPFIPEKMATLSGMLNGEMTITGSPTRPEFNGFIDFDTTAVAVKMLGTSFRFSDEKIPVDSGIVSFNNFNIFGCNSNPLTLNGTVNARNLANLAMNLSLKAKDIQIVNSDRPRGADVYGKAFLDIDASVRGNMKFMSVDADLSVLSGTNVTYVMTEASQTLSSQNTEDLVHFVEFNDTLNVIEADSIVNSAMLLKLDARLHLRQGCMINVDLSTNGSNKVSLLPSGDVNYSMSAFGGDRMTGRININGGYVRYTPPLMSEKNFTFKDGSYVAFTGDMMNPTLNIQAVDVVRANVTQSGQNSRLVNFDVQLSLTNTLENLNVAFDLSTNDDITVQNELASMSAEQRANQAMNLLLYNVYSVGDTKANANLSGNQLYSFLTSQLNSWAANNIKGVDISFGIDQYDKTYGGSTSTTTSYSYRVSKTFFNDRFKIIVGGNYSTDADADENFSQNLINDISFEYMLNRSGSMYVRIFRHTGYESILEGEITQTGVGFVLKRKLNSLRDIFGIRKD